jgi:outer membrane protein assembly factor BamB
MRLLLLLFAALLTAGCSIFGDDDEPVEPPAELTDFEPTVEVRRVWDVRFGKGSEGLLFGLSPATDGGRVYAGGRRGRVLAVDAASGDPVWAQKTDLQLSAGPAVGAGFVFFGTSDGEVVALSASDGTVAWRQPVSGEVLARPAISDDRLIVRTVDGYLRALSLADGSELWSVEQPVPRLTLRGNGAPEISGDVVVAGFDNGRIAAYELADGDVRWENVVAPSSGRTEIERLADVDASVEILDQDIYATSYGGRTASLALESGRILWSQDVSSYQGLSADWTNVFVTNDFSHVVSLSRASGGIVWEQDAMRMRSLTTPVPYANTIVVGDFEGYVHFLDVNSGALAARTRADKSPIVGTPLVVSDVVIVQTDDGRLAAFRIESQDG